MLDKECSERHHLIKYGGWHTVLPLLFSMHWLELHEQSSDNSTAHSIPVYGRVLIAACHHNVAGNHKHFFGNSASFHVTGNHSQNGVLQIVLLYKHASAWLGETADVTYAGRVKSPSKGSIPSLLLHMHKPHAEIWPEHLLYKADRYQTPGAG